MRLASKLYRKECSEIALSCASSKKKFLRTYCNKVFLQELCVVDRGKAAESGVNL
jgi:hypothetical protein